LNYEQGTNHKGMFSSHIFLNTPIIVISCLSPLFTFTSRVSTMSITIMWEHSRFFFAQNCLFNQIPAYVPTCIGAKALSCCPSNACFLYYTWVTFLSRKPNSSYFN
jgi:hypothetical protein